MLVWWCVVYGYKYPCQLLTEPQVQCASCTVWWIDQWHLCGNAVVPLCPTVTGSLFGGDLCGGLKGKRGMWDSVEGTSRQPAVSLGAGSASLSQKVQLLPLLPHSSSSTATFSQTNLSVVLLVYLLDSRLTRFKVLYYSKAKPARWMRQMFTIPLCACTKWFGVWELFFKAVSEMLHT